MGYLLGSLNKRLKFKQERLKEAEYNCENKTDQIRIAYWEGVYDQLKDEVAYLKRIIYLAKSE